MKIIAKNFLIKRLVHSFLIIFGILTLTFFIIHLAPGDPSDMYLSPEIDPSTVELIRKNLGLDQPLHIQYVKWISHYLRGDFGISFSKHRPVIDILKDAIPATLQLTLLALIIDFIVGTIIGIIAAIRKYSLWDHLLSFGTLFVYSVPGFWLALMLILIFSLKLGWLPSSQMSSINAVYMGFWGGLWDRLLHIIMPVLVLGIAAAAATARFMRASMLEALDQDYIRTARAKGLSERRVIFRHALKNALTPLITLFGLSFPFLLGGAVIIETIFAWPGMGRVTIDAILSQDYPVILATNFIAATMVVLGNLVADILYGVVDPRVRYER